MNNSTKVCTKCKSTLPATLEYFPAKKGTYDGLRADCRTCYSKYKAEYHAANREREQAKSKKRYWENREESLLTSKQWRERNKEKVKENNRRYREEHKEELKQYLKEYREKNKEILREKNRQFRKDNPEKVKARRKQDQERHKERIDSYARTYRKENYDQVYQVIQNWKKKNPERVAIYHSDRRGRVLGAEGSHTLHDIEKLREEQKGHCYYCQRVTKLTVDHKTPVSRGGSNNPDNLCLACGPCNSQKRDKTEAEYWEYRKKVMGQ